jgi:transposase
VAYVYSEDREGAHPAEHLKGFRGLLQTDGYAGFVRFVGSNPDVTHALCWSHARRKFFDIQAASKAPLADEAWRRIAGLYAIEIDLRGQTMEERLRVRQEQSRPLVKAMHLWMTEQLDRVPGRSDIAQAFRYALTLWDGLAVFLRDGRTALDTNVVERAMRPVALGRKNALFAGSDSGGRHWAIVSTLIQSAKLHNVEPLAWLTDVLERIVSGRTKSHQLDTLLPWNWDGTRIGQTTNTA